MSDLGRFSKELPPLCSQCGASSFERASVEGVVEHEYILRGVFSRQIEAESTLTVDEWMCTNCGVVVQHDTYFEKDLNDIVDRAELELPSQNR